jgi:hypothetical protein
VIFSVVHHQCVSGLAEHSKHGSGSSSGIDVSLWIAIAALLVSIVLPLYLDSRQAPRVRVHVRRYILASDNMKTYYAVMVLNRGRSSVFVNQVNFSYSTKTHPREVYILPQIERGPDRPHELGPYSDASFSTSEIDASDLIGGSRRVRLYGSVHLSNGYRVRSRLGLRLDRDRRGRDRSSLTARTKLLLLGRERMI